MQVGKITVNKVSGPMSYYVLEPKPEFKDKSLPVILLFGDEHESNENICKPGRDVYNIYDDDFLRQLQHLSPNLLRRYLSGKHLCRYQSPRL